MYFPRAVEARVRHLAEYFPVVAVTGGRQTGKTTLLRRCFPHHRYVSLDLPSTAELAERNPGEFLERYPAPLVIDEAQYAPALFRHLKPAIDELRHEPGRFILTGSQHFPLMKGVTESLAGRIGLLELETLSLAEIAPHVDLRERAALIRLMVRGQFPELWRVADLPASDFYASYVATYLERDVRQILNVTSLRDFERFIRILASRSATMLNKSDVARDVGVSVKAVGDWLSVLQASGQIALLEPWYTNIGKRIVKTPKVYFRDSGLLCYLLNLSEETLATSPLLGAVWETFVYAELRKRLAARSTPSSLWYYRDQRAREIDFIVDAGGELRFLEVKWREHPQEADARSILAVDRELRASNSPWRPGQHFVVGTPLDPYSVCDGVRAISVHELDEALA